MSFVSELKRRKVFQVAAVYLVVAWLIMQVVDVVNEPLRLPEWFATVAILIVAIGFPIALILSWAFDLTPEGVVRDQGTTVAAQSSGRGIEYVFIGLLVIAVATLLYREFTPPEQSVEVVAEESQREVLPNSVAVLPFENLSLDPENAFFAAGIHDTILHELSKIADMNVIARTSVLGYGDGKTPIAQIAEELNVETVMEGTVQYADDRVLVTAQLIDPKTSAHIWSGNYDREFADIFVIQADIATRIAMALEAEFSIAEQESVERIPTRSPEAYRLYLKALANVPNIAPISPPDFYAALKEAIVLDPDFALAHATLAFAYGRAFAFFDSVELAGSMEAHEVLIRGHAEAALRVDPNQGLAHGALATVEAAYHRLTVARSHWERAIEVNPNDVEVLDDAAIFYAYTDLDEANRLLTRIRELDPAVEGGAAYYIRLINGDFRDAAASFRNLMPLIPDEFPMRKFLYTEIGLSDALAGDRQLAVEELRLAEQLEPKSAVFLLSRIAYAYHRAGQPEDAERIVQQIQNMAGDQNFSDQILSVFWVFAYLAVGDEANALAWLNTVADDPGARAGGMEPIMDLVKNFLVDPILDQPEWVEVRSRLGFRE